MQCDSPKTYSRCDRVSARYKHSNSGSAAPFFQVVANLTGFYPRSMKKVRPQPLQIVFSLPCGRILPIPRNLCVTPLWDTTKKLWPTSARALHKTLRPRGDILRTHAHYNLLLSLAEPHPRAPPDYRVVSHIFRANLLQVLRYPL